ncbi:CREB/ATF bZIP transcription factor [Ambystoma mexicanum]|uniref:CREB/ATF bZIP transcription factor n=1 Tax=Ambystoma mexicanum TaxID=8296 RepID=UPI0037E78AFB
MRATRSCRYLAQLPRVACGAGGTEQKNGTDGPNLAKSGVSPTTWAAEARSPTTTMSSQSSPSSHEDVDLLSSLELVELLGRGGQCWEAPLHEEMWNDDQSVSLSEPDTLPFGELLQQLVNYEKTQDQNGYSLSGGPPIKGISRKTSGRYEANKSSKNAAAARLNRLRKKEYVMGLEAKVTCLSSENLELKEENRQLGKRVKDLEEETKYLKAVLANESVLSQLLGRLTGLKGMRLTTSLFRENGEEMDHDYALPRKRVKVEEQESTSGGICLHVDKEQVSVEFCSSCARNACSTVKILFFR